MVYLADNSIFLVNLSYGETYATKKIRLIQNKHYALPESGDINGFVRDLANREMIYPELKDLFEGFNRTIRFSCAEKVLVGKAGKLPFYDALKVHGVGAEDKLPFDCMTWFSISTTSLR